MELIDTHAHLDAEAFRTDLEGVLSAATDAGVQSIFSIGITLQTSLAAVELATRHDNVFAVVGIQPNYAAEAGPDDLEQIEVLLSSPKVVGIGETGLDKYWDFAPLDKQADYFDEHLRLAKKHRLPFIVHCRDAEDEVVEQLTRFADGEELTGVMHSFCGDAATAGACLNLGLHLSFSGMLTYKKNKSLREVAAGVPLDRLLIETDAPYLVPTPKRGKVKRNEPALVRHTCEVLADVHGKTPEEMGAITTANARRLFKLDEV